MDKMIKLTGNHFGFIHPDIVSGEIVFNTGMVGYVEALTDPSYKGQMIMLTYPLIGNYGVPEIYHDKFGLEYPFESNCIHTSALIVSRYEDFYSHPTAIKSLKEWLVENKITALTNIDTRKITKIIRENGTMLAEINPSGELNLSKIDSNVNLVSSVSTLNITNYNIGSAKTLLLIDCGAKNNIIRQLLERNVNVIRVPWNYDFILNPNNLKFDGLFLSNGPGDPKDLTQLINLVKQYMLLDKPIFGICLGNQILALSGGLDTYKLPYGHRSQNQPVKNIYDQKCYITSQNHGYAIKNGDLNGFSTWFVNINDGTNEGIIHISKPWMSVQFHPEAFPGPTDVNKIFDYFIEKL